MRRIGVYANFNPRSPYGERRGLTVRSPCYSGFQSTLSMRRATLAGFMAYLPDRISIHALHAESDNTAAKRAQAGTYFNPRSPCGERRIVMVLKYTHEYFNPRSPCGERLSELRLSMCH